MDRGHTDQDRPAIDVDDQDRAHVSVVTQSTDFHTAIGGCTEVAPGPYVVRLSVDGSSFDSCVGLGGDDFANSVALDPSGNVYITGRSSGGGYPITIGGAPAGDAVATKLDDALSSVQYSLTLGYTEGLGIAVDSLGRATVVGTDGADAGFTLLAANGQITHETFWGGSLFDQANGVALDPLGHAYVTGETRSTGFPGDTVLNSSPFQAARSGNIDAWIVKHLRDDPVVLVPSMSWGLLLVAGVPLMLGGRLARA